MYIQRNADFNDQLARMLQTNGKFNLLMSDPDAIGLAGPFRGILTLVSEDMMGGRLVEGRVRLLNGSIVMVRDLTRDDLKGLVGPQFVPTICDQLKIKPDQFVLVMRFESVSD